MTKTDLYQELLKRMQEAIENEFFLEASWIQYAICEDRLNSVIRHAYPEKGEIFLKDFRMMSRKIEHIIKKIHPTNEGARKTVHKELLERLECWKGKRDDLMHEIANTADFKNLQNQMKSLASEGLPIVKELCSHVSKFKQKKHNG